MTTNTEGVSAISAKLDEQIACKNCRFFDPQNFDGGLGYCRRFPPNSPVLDDGEWHWYFAEVTPDDWCGEFKTTSNPKISGPSSAS